MTSTPAKLKNPQVIEDLLLFRLSRVMANGGAPIIRLCEGQLGITWREWRVIATLRPDVSMLSSALAERAQLDRARTSRAVTSLVAKGLVERREVPGDQRKAALRLTPSGCELYNSFFPVVAGLNAQLVQSLSPQELELLDRALSAIQTEAEKFGSLPDLPKANRRQGGRNA